MKIVNQAKMSFLHSFHCPSRYADMDMNSVHPREYAVSINGFPDIFQAYIDLSTAETPKRCVNSRKNAKSDAKKDEFEMHLDVQQFQPNEISVKTVNNSVIVEAKHEEKQDGDGYISRQFARRFVLPDRYRAEDVVSSLSSDGILTVKASLPPAIEGNTRSIEIQHTGPARRNCKANKVANDAEKTNGATKNDTNNTNEK